MGASLFRALEETEGGIVMSDVRTEGVKEEHPTIPTLKQETKNFVIPKIKSEDSKRAINKKPKWMEEHIEQRKKEQTRIIEERRKTGGKVDKRSEVERRGKENRVELKLEGREEGKRKKDEIRREEVRRKEEV